MEDKIDVRVKLSTALKVVEEAGLNPRHIIISLKAGKKYTQPTMKEICRTGRQMNLGNVRLKYTKNWILCAGWFCACRQPEGVRGAPGSRCTLSVCSRTMREANSTLHSVPERFGKQISPVIPFSNGSGSKCHPTFCSRTLRRTII
ncbi:MAG: hypothetical protein LBL07_06255 [Tannerella sp.]|nr:hypothetical protein [Tannerella sp.]